jgi:hypothetical protein
MMIFKRLYLSFSIITCLGVFACSPGMLGVDAELTDEEKEMPEAAFYSTEFAEVPDEVADAVSNGPISPDQALAFEDINDLAKPGYLEVENGYGILEDGTAYVAVRTDFPDADKEMVHWWFWWHAVENVRYKIWYPGAHYAIGAEDMEQLTDESLIAEERYLNNPHYPVEDVGTGVMSLSIRFMSPEAFGFDTSTFKDNDVEAVVCGVVGLRIFNFTIEHSYLCHLFRKNGDDLELRSRFWLGAKLESLFLRKLFINEALALGMMRHCSGEYTHLASFLPEIFNEFSDSEL